MICIEFLYPVLFSNVRVRGKTHPLGSHKPIEKYRKFVKLGVVWPLVGHCNIGCDIPDPWNGCGHSLLFCG